MSQEKLAEALNIAPSSLSYVETGRGFMTLSTLEKLSQLLQVEMCELFRFSSINTKEEMYNYILSGLDLIKNDDEKLKFLFNLVKNLI